MKKRTVVIFFMIVVSLTFLILPTLYAKKSENEKNEKFAFVADLSGSMVEVNQRYNLFQALELAAGLAPDSSEIALIGVNSDIVVETEFFDPAVLSQRRSLEQTAKPVHGESAFAFSGRLDFYVVKLSQKNYEIAPFTCYLTTIVKREVSLQEVFDRCSVRHTFTGADKICFAAGPDKTLLVKNSGPAELLLRSAVVRKDQNSRISFGEKLYFTAADGISEIAIYYRNARKA